MRSIFVDDSGYIYATGLFRDTMDFDPGPDVFEIDLVGGSDIFIEKLDPDGNLVWVKQIAGISYESPGNIVLDTMGNIIVSGQFSGTVDFDPGSGEYFMTLQNVSVQKRHKVFITKLLTSIRKAHNWKCFILSFSMNCITC